MIVTQTEQSKYVRDVESCVEVREKRKRGLLSISLPFHPFMHLAHRLTDNNLDSKPLFPRKGVEHPRSQSLSKMDPDVNEVLFLHLQNTWKLLSITQVNSSTFNLFLILPAELFFRLLDFGVLKKDSTRIFVEHVRHFARM